MIVCNWINDTFEFIKTYKTKPVDHISLTSLMLFVSFTNNNIIELFAKYLVSYDFHCSQCFHFL